MWTDCRAKMKYIILLTIFITAKAGVINKDECNGVKINNVYYENQTLHEGLDRPYLLAVDHSTNILYFSYSASNSDDGFKTARINLNTKEFHDIQDINNGFAQTVDQKSHEIYIGGSDGIYKYDYGKDKTTFIGERGVDIWNLYFKDVLYYSSYPSQFLYTYVNGTATRFKDLEDTKVDSIAIDNDDVIFFTNATGLFSQQKGTKDSVLYQEFPFNGVRSLATNLEGKVYVCLQDGVYVANKETAALDKILSIDDAFGLTFDNDDNIVYSDATKVVRLVPNKHKAC